MKYLIIIIVLLTSVNAFTQAKLPYNYKVPDKIEDGLETASLSSEGIDSNKIIDLTNKIINDSYHNIHSLLILRNNKLVYEEYFPGQEDLFYGDSSIVEHHKDYIHECRSITKSVVSACIGIAIAQGKIKSVNESIFHYLPEYEEYATGLKRNITIEHLLTMSSGIKWTEGETSASNQEVTMMHSSNPVEYFLSQQMVANPGESWNYNGGCTQALGAIIKISTGEDIDSFAYKNIFLPLGITSFKWDRTKDGFHWCASGLRLKPRDTAKLGLLYANKGLWKNKQIIPSSWISKSFKYHYTAVEDPKTFYGYQFWGADLKVDGQTLEAFAAIGNGGQIILIFPTASIVIVVTAGNYYNELSNQSFRLIADDIIPAIEIRKRKAKLNK